MIGRKKGILKNNNWKKLEKELKKQMEKDNPNYNFQSQKVYKHDGKRPDVFGQHKQKPFERKVGEAKCVKELKPEHVRQAIGYKKHPGYARGGDIGVCQDTKVPHEVRRQAKNANFKVRRLNVSRKKGFFDF